MSDAIISLAVGAGVGAVFGFFGAGVPAPPTIAGVLGVAGISLGYFLVSVVKV